jgi:hypothetical protein
VPRSFCRKTQRERERERERERVHSLAVGRSLARLLVAILYLTLLSPAARSHSLASLSLSLSLLLCGSLNFQPLHSHAAPMHHPSRSIQLVIVLSLSLSGLVSPPLSLALSPSSYVFPSLGGKGARAQVRQR